MIISLEQLIIFVYDGEKREFKTSNVSFEQAQNYTSSEPLCAMSILTDYKNAFFKMGNRGDIIQGADPNDAMVLDYDHTLKHIVITGHKDGKICIWRL